MCRFQTVADTVVIVEKVIDSFLNYVVGNVERIVIVHSISIVPACFARLKKGRVLLATKEAVILTRTHKSDVSTNIASCSLNDASIGGDRKS